MDIHSEFSRRPLIAGNPLVGLRSFVLHDGRLTALMSDYAWTPGENVAVCDDGAVWSGGPNWRGHQVASRACTCGFYAYYDGSNQFARAFRSHVPMVSGIIEGYGVMVVGSRGFRCEKARIVALVRPRRVRAWRYSLVIFWWAVAASDLNSSVARATQGNWWMALLFLGFAIWFILSALKQRHPRPNEISRADFHRVQDTYQVPIYRSVRAALQAHPLTPVPELLDGAP